MTKLELYQTKYAVKSTDEGVYTSVSTWIQVEAKIIKFPDKLKEVLSCDASGTRICIINQSCPVNLKTNTINIVFSTGEERCFQLCDFDCEYENDAIHFPLFITVTLEGKYDEEHANVKAYNMLKDANIKPFNVDFTNVYEGVLNEEYNVDIKSLEHNIQDWADTLC